ncbi:hypothetical protein ACLOJK_033813 [Asimina triloba]
MEFLDEEARPRFLFQSRASSSPIQTLEETPKPSKTIILICISLSSLLIFLSFFSPLSQFQTLQFLLLWFSISLLLGPFAPTSSTGGDIRVGVGEPLHPPPDPDPTPAEESKKKITNRRLKAPPQRTEEPIIPAENPKIEIYARSGNGETAVAETRIEEEEKEWDEADLDLLKKQIAKHPVGAPRRWEATALAFRGRHGLESVIRTAKSLAEKRSGAAAGDPFAQFLKQRKPLSKRLEGGDGDGLPSSSQASTDGGESKNESSEWSIGEDLALLNALKAFSKDASMRWEKITAAVPGKSKSLCMKRVAELKRDFRSTKASDN